MSQSNVFPSQILHRLDDLSADLRPAPGGGGGGSDPKGPTLKIGRPLPPPSEGKISNKYPPFE